MKMYLSPDRPATREELAMTTATEYREQADEARQRSADSFERCDTDGFMSQWASDLTARELDLKASVADGGGKWTFAAIFTADGELTDFRMVNTRYGSSWVRDTDKGSEWFNDSSACKGARRLTADTRKGYVRGLVRQDAYVTMAGSGTGMSGAMSCRPIVLPVRDAAREIVTVLDEGYYGENW